jgi:acylphosphatase
MQETDKNNTRERLVIVGNVGSPTFVPWIERHASKLGLTGLVCRGSARCMEVEADGLEEMLDALEVGCLLGPAEVWVERVSRVRLSNG